MIDREVLIFTTDSRARNIIASLSKSTSMLAGQNTYYVGKDRKTGKKRYIVRESCVKKLQELIDCEVSYI